jgi:small subunit ribosomal protein S18
MAMKKDFGGGRRPRRIEAGVKVDPKDYELLRKFVTDHGKIMPARLTGATAKQQRRIRQAVRRSRVMGQLP